MEPTLVKVQEQILERLDSIEAKISDIIEIDGYTPPVGWIWQHYESIPLHNKPYLSLVLRTTWTRTKMHLMVVDPSGVCLHAHEYKLTWKKGELS